jgi:4-hydroxy-3-polyprenylbenzoate decarboxylase
MAFWSALPQFTYTKFVIVVDKEINIRDPRQVVWAISSKVDPTRDVFILPETPFDTLDFASEKIGLGGRMAIDATTKIYPETEHEWGEVLESDEEMAKKVNNRWAEYGLSDINLGEINPNLFGYDIKI